MKRAAVFVIGLCVIASSAAEAGFKDAEPGGCKLSFSSLPFFGSDEEEPDRPAAFDDYEQEYIVDATGRRVPVKTERSGTARPVGKQGKSSAGDE